MKLNLTRQQVEQGLHRLLENPGGFPVQEPFPDTSRPFTELCQDWLALQAEISRLSALNPDSERVKALEDALREIALAGMTLPLGCIEEDTQKFHASNAWKFIQIAAKALASKPGDERGKS